MSEEAHASHARETKRGKMRLLWIAVPLVMVGAFGALRLRSKPVTTVAAVRGTAVDAVYAIATVEALDRVTVKAKVSGSILELKAREGDSVKRGDLLALIDNPSLKFQLDRGKAEQWAASQFASASSPQIAVVEAQAKVTESSLKNAREEKARLESLVASGASPRSQLDAINNQVAGLEAQLASQVAQVKALKIELSAKSRGTSAAVSEFAAKLSDAEVRAPIDGVVLTRSVEPGELVPLNGPLYKIGDVSSLILECSVDETDIGRVAVGKKAAVSLYAFPKQIFEGKVFEILPDADRTKKSFVVKVRLQSPPPLRSGMSAEVNIVVDEHPNALLIPSEAVDVTDSVWLVHDGKVEKRTIKIGVRDLLRAEVLSGLSDADEVIVSANADLKDGMRVSATRESERMHKVVSKEVNRGGGSL